MTTLAKMLGAIVLPSAALSLSAIGLTVGNAAESDTPMQCEISVSKDRYGHTYKGLLKAAETVQGYYELNLAQRNGGYAVISQSGEFYVKAGDTQLLGQATFGGVSPDGVEAELVLHVDGKKYLCSTQSEI